MSKGFYRFVKRCFDILFGIAGCVFLLPVWLTIKILYLFDGDTHGVIYKQPRVGKDGKIFNLYKFRSMVWNADEVLVKLLQQKNYRDQWMVYQKLDDDPRITKIGKVIRHGSIDEIPQFINILKGEMSLIGPRPVVPGELKNHRVRWKFIQQYKMAKPGISGYWATRGRSDIDYDERVKMELFYVDNCGFALDTKIFFRTFGTIFRGGGAK